MIPISMMMGSIFLDFENQVILCTHEYGAKRLTKLIDLHRNMKREAILHSFVSFSNFTLFNSLQSAISDAADFETHLSAFGFC